MGTKQAHHMSYLSDEITVSHNHMFRQVISAAINHNMKPIRNGHNHAKKEKKQCHYDGNLAHGKKK